MRVWVCVTWETDGYDYFGEDVTLWFKEEDAIKHGNSHVEYLVTSDYTHGSFTVYEREIK